MTMTKAVRMRGTRLLAEALLSGWERRARALGGTFIAAFNHHSGKAAGEPPRPAESEATMREARLDARERRVRAEMRKRNEFLPESESPAARVNAKANPFLPESESPAARVNAKANPFLPKDLEIDGRNPFVPK